MESAQVSAALLTPLAPGAIAVVGLAGPGVDELIACVTVGPHASNSSALAHDKPVLRTLIDGDDTLDDALIVRSVSRAGLARADLCFHGGVRVAQRVLELMRRQGAAVIEAWAWQRQFGGNTGVETDIDESLARCASRRLAEWLIAQRRQLPPFLTAWKEHGPAEREAFRRRTRVAARLVAGMHVVLLGPPNAGKSSLANRLIGRPRAITSPQAGTTRDWISETALVDGWPVILTDTAGLRESACAMESEAIRRGTGRAAAADATVIVMDATATALEREREGARVRESVPDGIPIVEVLNKCDVADICSEGGGALAISALTGTGIETLEMAIVHALGLDLLDASLPTGFLPGHIPDAPSILSDAQIHNSPIGV